MPLPVSHQQPDGRLDEMLAALFGGAMLPVKVRLGAAKSFPLASKSELERSGRLLQQADQLARQHAPGSAPPLDLAAALWAAQVFQFASNRLVDRIEAETALPQHLEAMEPTGTSPSEHWSVDLVFRTWWDLIKRSMKESKEDTLNNTLFNIASRWPLAAVGTPAEIVENRMQVIWNQECLRLVYIDRVIARADHQKQVSPWWPHSDA